MPVPTDISTLSTTASTNYPAGIEFAYEGDNHLRQIYAFFAYMRDGFHGRRNRIINGNMRVDQRYAGTGININSALFTYVLDRWAGWADAADGVFTIQQLATGTPPAGFTHYLRCKTTTADAAIGSSQVYVLRQAIEGNNVADLDFGLSTAKSVTVSFWVRSSLTGTFGGSLRNSANDRTYPFSYAISAANTWEYKTVTIAGDTTGTWLTDTGIGLQLMFDIGSGSTYKGTAGAWSSTNYLGVTGATNLIGTLNATLDFTGVQLEAGAQATGFQYVQHADQMVLCQRYYQAGVVGNISYGAAGAAFGLQSQFPVLMRAAPTMAGTYAYTNAATGVIDTISAQGFKTYATVTGLGAAQFFATYTADAEL